MNSRYPQKNLLKKCIFNSIRISSRDGILLSARTSLNILFCLVFISGTNISHSADLLDDRFSDGSRAAGGGGDAAWFARNSSTAGTAWTIRTDNTSPLSAKVLGYFSPSTAENTTMIASLPVTVELEKAGDSIEFSFDGRSTTGTATTGALIATLGYDNGTPITGDEFGAASTTGDDILVSAQLSNATYFKDQRPYAIIYKVTLAPDADSLVCEMFVDGVNKLTRTIATPATKRFNQVRILWNGGASPNIDNVRVTTTATIGLLPVVRGTPQAWLVAGIWIGKSGIGTSGPDAEVYANPNPGDYTPKLSALDSTFELQWNGRSAEGGRVNIRETDQSYAWPGGTAYAALYVYSPISQIVSMRSIQSGSATLGWLRGVPVAFETDTNPPTEFSAFPYNSAERAIKASLPLNAGWNRLLLKFTTNQAASEQFAFSVKFADESGAAIQNLLSQIRDPGIEPNNRQAHYDVQRLVPRVYTDAPSNLVASGSSVKVFIDTKTESPQGSAPVPYTLGRYRVTMRNYSGGFIATKEINAGVPGISSLSFDNPLSTGYYILQIEFLDVGNKRIAAFRPSGFSVIKGSTAQAARKNQKKLAYSYYYMTFSSVRYADCNYKIVFPWLQRMGILRTVGSDFGSYDADFWQSANDAGVAATADFGDAHSSHTPARKRDYALLAAQHTKFYKSYNEIDFPSQIVRPSPSQWVERMKIEYAPVLEFHGSDGGFMGGSLARPGADSWFQDCLQLGLGEYQDLWDVHAYPQIPPLLGGTIFNGSKEGDIAVEQAHSNLGLINTKPYWIGECGARDPHGLNGRRWQADTTAKMVACAGTRPTWQVMSFLVPSHYNPSIVYDIAMGHMPGEAALYTAGALIDGFPYSPLSSPGVSLNDASGHQVKMRLTRTSGGLQVSTSVDGLLLPGTTYKDPATYTFGYLNLSSYLNASLRIDNVKVQSSSSGIVINDMFLDGSLNDGSNPGEIDTQWYFYNSSSAGTAWGTITDNTAPLSGTAMNNPGGTATNTRGVCQWNPITLEANGSWIEVNLDFRCGAAPGAGMFSVLIGNPIGDNMTSNIFGGPSPFADDFSYGLKMSFPSKGLVYLENRQTVSTTRGTGDIQIGKFGPTRMIWCVGGGPIDYRMELPSSEGQNWVQVDVVGRVSPLTKNTDGQTATITITDSPVYLLPQTIYDDLTR